jgi:type IV pilus assembly protein PilQ
MAYLIRHLRTFAAALVLGALLVACQTASTPENSTARNQTAARTSEPKAKAPPPNQAPPARAKKAPTAPLPSVEVSRSNYEVEVNKIVELAGKNEWEEAETRASALYALDPNNYTVQRIYKWVKTEGSKRRNKTLEDQLRDVNTKDSRFYPTIKDLLTARKSRGLEPRTDLREAVEQMKAAPYIPENFGRIVEARGSLEDIDSGKGRMSAILEKEVSVMLDNVTIESIIFNVGQAEGINFIADKSIPAFQQKLSLNMKNVKLSELLLYLTRNYNLQFQVGSDLIWIVDAKDPKKMIEETRFYRLRRGFVLPAQFGASDIVKNTVTANNVTTVTETQKIDAFVRDGAPKLPSLEGAIKNFFEGTKYYIDYERNLLVARGTHEQLAVLDKIIEEFDKPMQQVLIEARFITVTEAAFLKLGINWETGRDPLTIQQTATDYTGISGSGVGYGLQHTWTGIFNQETLSATLTAIDQTGESENLSSPRLTVINNLPSTISDGKVQYYYDEYTVTQTILERTSSSKLVPAGKPTKLQSGVVLDVLASIGGDGESIMLALRPEVTSEAKLVTFASINDRDETGKLVSSFDIRLPETTTQSLATRVVVRSGQTVVMGGVMEREQRTFVEAVPVLGNIPIIGALFRKREEYDRPRFLLVFVTATLLSESGEFVVSPETK